MFSRGSASTIIVAPGFNPGSYNDHTPWNAVGMALYREKPRKKNLKNFIYKKKPCLQHSIIIFGTIHRVETRRYNDGRASGTEKQHLNLL